MKKSKVSGALLRQIGLIAFAALSFMFFACPQPDSGTTGPKEYRVQIEAQNGTIKGDPDHGPEGTAISVRVNPDSGYTYQAGSLKYNSIPISDTSGQPYTFNMPASDVTLTAVFEKVPDGNYTVTIGGISNGSITANPLYAQPGTTITLTFTPASGYGLKEGSLKITKTDGGEVTPATVTITSAAFTMPAAHVTVSAEFEQKNTAELISQGTSALADGKFDTAITAFEAAYQANKNDPEAIVYSSLGKLAAIATSENVRKLMSDRLGLTGYPGTLDKLLSPDWMETYTDEKFVDWYNDGGEYFYWHDADDTWFFNYYELPPKSGYYRGQSLNPTELKFVSGTKKNGRLDSYYEGSNYYHWYDADDAGFFSNHGLPPQSGYYLWDYSNQTYVFVTREPKYGPLDSYYDENTGRQVNWFDSEPGNTTGFQGAGYYYYIGYKYTFVSGTPRYDQWTDKLPGFSMPDWFKDTGIYKDSFTSNNLESASTMYLLMYANLVDKNPQGLNALLDDLLSSAFGSEFEAAVARAAALGDSTVEVDEKILEAFGLSEIFEGDKISIGKAELNLLFSAVRIFKASLEWVAAYDWNTDLTFLKFDWKELENGFGSHKPADLPLRNNFMKDRNNGMMAKSKADFIKAIDDSIAAYDHLISDAGSYPQAAKDTLKEYQWIKDALGKLKDAINSGGNFYIKESASGATYNNTAADAVFGINLGKLFTPGQLSIDKLIETAGTGNSIAPKFYGFADGDDENPVVINNKSEIQNYQIIGFQIKLTPVKEIVVQGFGDLQDTLKLSMFPPKIAESLWDFYH
jgi:hypothetical protein